MKRPSKAIGDYNEKGSLQQLTGIRIVFQNNFVHTFGIYLEIYSFVFFKHDCRWLNLNIIVSDVIGFFAVFSLNSALISRPFSVPSRVKRSVNSPKDLSSFLSKLSREQPKSAPYLRFIKKICGKKPHKAKKPAHKIFW